MVRIGILGAGRVVQQRYTEVFRDELKDARIIAVCDRVQQRADQVATALGADAVYDGDDLLVRPDLDAILVATESGKHFRHARTVLAAGKHVIVEKPPALIPDEISAAVDLAKKKGLMYAVIFQNRLNPAMEILKETFLQGRFGEMVLATIRLRWCRYQEYYEDGWHGTWAMDGGVINQQAIHHIDALQWICGSVSEVCAAQSNALNQLEAEDTTAAVVKFENGALGVIEATTAARPEDFEASISIVGEEGMAVIGGIALNQIDTWQFVRPIEDDLVIPERYSQNVPTGYGLSHGPLMQEIVDRLNQGRIEPPITGADVVPTVRLVHAIYKSQETNGWTRLSDQPLSMRLGAG
jgi:predicted dehydrogenase